MPERFVTFDCAGTLLKVDWVPGKFAVECANEAGLSLGEPEEADYAQLLRRRWSAYEDLNTTRDHAALDGFWRQLTMDWLSNIGQVASVDAVLEVARVRIFDKFEIYDDVLPVLDHLDKLGARVAIISNWDYSLHRILKNKGLTDRFEFALASLEEGVEKPHERLYQIALDRLGAKAEQVAHVGDDPLDDLRGAQDAGLRGLLIDRSLGRYQLPRLARLTEIPEVLGWG